MSTSQPKSRPSRSLVVNLALIALAFGLLGLAIHNNREQIRDVFRHGIDTRLFAMTVALYLVPVLLTFVRWYALVRVIEDRFTLRDAVLLGFIGNVFNLVIPGAVGGDFIKAAYLVRMDIRRTQAIASMVIDRILGLLGLFVLAAAAGVAAWPRAGQQVRILIILAWVAVAGGLLVLTMIFSQRLTRSFPSLLEGPGKLATILVELRVMSETYRKRLGLVAGMLGLSTLIHVLNVVAFYLASKAIFPTPIPSFGAHLLMVPLTLFTTAVPIPFGALGLTEQVSSELFRLVNHPGGAVAMMAFRVLMYCGGLIGVGVYLTRIQQVRALSAAARTLEEEVRDPELIA
ncbi:MAG: lysylphosphatidylglycerol synthase transmembrane domain-containing protein [Isosphaeraceae bacterium]